MPNIRLCVLISTDVQIAPTSMAKPLLHKLSTAECRRRDSAIQTRTRMRQRKFNQAVLLWLVNRKLQRSIILIHH